MELVLRDDSYCNCNETLQQLTISDLKGKIKKGVTKANVIDRKTPTSGVAGTNELSIYIYIYIYKKIYNYFNNYTIPMQMVPQQE